MKAPKRTQQAATSHFLARLEALQPPTSLLAKLGSIVVHVQEGRSTDGHVFDQIACEALLDDPEVNAWLGAMRKLSLVPVKRNSQA